MYKPQRKIQTEAKPVALHRQIHLLLVVLMMTICSANAQGPSRSWCNTTTGFPLATQTRQAPLIVDTTDFTGVRRAARDLASDIQRVTGKRPQVLRQIPAGEQAIIIAGTLGHHALIDEWVRDGKLQVNDVAGKWESFVIQTLDNPIPGIAQALVIAGSDKRGTIYGIYEVSRQIGVSPWYWWADVTPTHQDNLYITPGRYVTPSPVVQYRGIFLNDEEPALGRWAVEKFGGFNHQFYEKVFELILRLRGNYLWPAMWWASFNADDPLNPKLADEYGVVIGTSHHEPMNRAHADWKKRGRGPWNYETNREVLQQFWREGIQQMGNYETFVTLAMRGDGDMAMTEEMNIALLERIVADQRKIIQDVTNKPVEQTPQVWALYKEVQAYYDKGMRVPDDVMLLLCDDNWGNIRKLPHPGDKPRRGRYGIYYHFDYVGDPRNYKWINTNALPRIWEQMNLAYAYGATRLWIVNVGDLKPMEFPLSFFLDYAWNPEAIPHDQLEKYTEAWCAAQFGQQQARDIARIIRLYTQYNSRRKPELLSADTYSLLHYREAERVVQEYRTLADEALRLQAALPPALHDAYFQLVLHPVAASANLYSFYLAVARNRWYAKQGRASTHTQRKLAIGYFEQDKTYTTTYHTMRQGKWNHMMSQTHISYTYWQQPERDVLPPLDSLALPTRAEMGVYAEGMEQAWPTATSLTLPTFYKHEDPSYYIDIFNRGTKPFPVKVKSAAPWIRLSSLPKQVGEEVRVDVRIDWRKVPAAGAVSTVDITGPDGQTARIAVRAVAPVVLAGAFVEGNGYISIEADHLTQATSTPEAKWTILPGHGRTRAGITTFPVTTPRLPQDRQPYVEYTIQLQDTGRISIHTYCSPTIDFLSQGGLQYGIAVDDEPRQVVNLHANDHIADWMRSVSNNIRVSSSVHHIKTPGKHTIRFYRIDPGVILQKIVVDTGGLQPSYLGPPESHRQP